MTAAIVVTGLVALAALAYFVHRFFDGEHLLPDLLDEIRLARADLASLDRSCAENPRQSEVVVSLTTIPSRIDHIDRALKSLLAQSVAPRQILLNVPDRSIREGTDYVIPDRLRTLSRVTIVPCRDWGPATKAIPSLLSHEPEQKIVVVDDDRIYPPNLIEDLDAASANHPDDALAMSGWIVPEDLTDRPTTIMSNLLMQPPAPVRATRLRDPYEVDIFQGLSGYLVKPRFFDREDLVDYDGMPEAAFFVDDVWLSGQCRARKYVIAAKRIPFPPKQHRKLYKSSSLGLINRGDGIPEMRNNTIMIRAMADRWTVGGPAGPS